MRATAAVIRSCCCTRAASAWDPRAFGPNLGPLAGGFHRVHARAARARAHARRRRPDHLADDDEVQLEHALELCRALPDAELAVVPGTSHGLLVEKPELCNTSIVDFLTNDPVATIAPVRRAR